MVVGGVSGVVVVVMAMEAEAMAVAVAAVAAVVGRLVVWSVSRLVV